MKLYTSGYEKISLESCLQMWKAAGINAIGDVRAIPVSRKQGFSKASLSKSLTEMGIEYYHLKWLGNPKEGRIAAKEGRFDEFRAIFGNHLKRPEAALQLAKLAVLAREKTVCLLCFERDQQLCHRSIVAGKIVGAEIIPLTF